MYGPQIVAIQHVISRSESVMNRRELLTDEVAWRPPSMHRQARLPNVVTPPNATACSQEGVQVTGHVTSNTRRARRGARRAHW